MKKKRLLFLLCRFLDGGIDTILVEYLNNIDFSKYDVTFGIGVAMGEKEVFLSRISPKVRIVHIIDEKYLSRLLQRKLYKKLSLREKISDELILNPIRRFLTRRRLNEMVLSHDAVVDFDSTFYSMLRGCRKPVVGFYHFSIAENLKRYGHHTRRQMAGMKKYAKIVVVSDIMLEEGRRLFPELEDKFVRIYNGFDLDKIVRQADIAPTLEIPLPYFISVARLEESQKDHQSLIRAYAEFRKNTGCTPTPLLVLVGKGRDREMLSGLVRSLDLQESVVMAGFVENPFPLVKRSVALILSSNYEGFGLVLVEGMALGVPVVASDCPSGPAEILENGKSGVLFTPGDTDALASNMELLAADSEEHRRYSEASLRRSRDFSIKESVDKLMELLT